MLGFIRHPTRSLPELVLKLSESLTIYSTRIPKRVPRSGTQWSNLSEDVSSRLLIFNTSLHLHQIALRPDCYEADSSARLPLSLSPSRPLSAHSIPPRRRTFHPPSHPLIVWIPRQTKNTQRSAIDMNNSALTLFCTRKTALCPTHIPACRAQQRRVNWR